MRSVFVAFDPPMPPTGGGTRTYHMLKAVTEVSSCNLLVCFPVSLTALPIDVREGCETVDVTQRPFTQASTSRFRKWFHQMRMLLLPFTMTAESIVSLADYYLLHPSGSSNVFKQRFYELIRRSLFRQAKKNYAAGFRYPARTLERILQYRDLEEKLRASLATSDLLWIDFSYPLLFFDWVKQEFPAIKLICNAHNLEYLFYERMALVATDSLQKEWLFMQAKLMKQAELNGFRKCDQVVVCSDADQEVLTKLIPSVHIKVLPNGVDLSYFQSSDSEPAKEPVILFTGTMNYAPNQDAVQYFIHSIFPHIREEIPNCKFVVAGANASAVFPEYSQMEGVELVNSPADMRPYYNKANVVVVPLRSGSGTRLKILEAVAMKKPVVSTSIGAEGLDLTNNMDLLLADEEKDFSNKLLSIINNPEDYKTMVEAAYTGVTMKYDWTIIRNKMSSFLKSLFVQ